jgi:hypothetical protein
MSIDFDAVAQQTAEIEAYISVVAEELDRLVKAMAPSSNPKVVHLREVLDGAFHAIRHLQAQRNAYKGVLRGMEFNHIDVIAALEEDQAVQLGAIAMNRINDFRVPKNANIH